MVLKPDVYAAESQAYPGGEHEWAKDILKAEADARSFAAIISTKKRKFYPHDADILTQGERRDAAS